MFCEKCGSELNEGAEFCSKCGTGAKEKKSKKDIKINKDKVTEISALDKKECWKKTLTIILWCFSIPSILFMGENIDMVAAISLVFGIIVGLIYHVNKFVDKKAVICPCCNNISYFGNYQLSKMEEFTCSKCYNHSVIKDNKVYATEPEFNENHKIYTKNNIGFYIILVISIIIMIISGVVAYNNKIEDEKNDIIRQQEREEIRKQQEEANKKLYRDKEAIQRKWKSIGEYSSANVTKLAYNKNVDELYLYIKNSNYIIVITQYGGVTTYYGANIYGATGTTYYDFYINNLFPMLANNENNTVTYNATVIYNLLNN